MESQTNGSTVVDWSALSHAQMTEVLSEGRAEAAKRVKQLTELLGVNVEAAQASAPKGRGRPARAEGNTFATVLADIEAAAGESTAEDAD